MWKSYKPYGVNFGSKSYAPTAADIAKWCGKKKKLLKLSTYNGKSDRLLPGDLIFYRKRSGKNGRYKNIDHIAMYVGNRHRSYMQMEAVCLTAIHVPQSCSNRQTSKIKEKYKDKEVQKADNKDTKFLLSAF